LRFDSGKGLGPFCSECLAVKLAALEKEREDERREGEEALKIWRLEREKDRLEREKDRPEREARQRELARLERERFERKQERDRLERETRFRVDEDTRAELRARLEAAGGRIGDINISLMWDNFNDLDLHVICPSGERIHSGNRISECDGELDVDANSIKPLTRKPVQNVVWDVGNSKDGLYKVYVHYYKKNEGVHYSKRDSIAKEDPTEFKLITGVKGEFKEYNTQLSYGDPMMVVTEFTVGDG